MSLVTSTTNGGGLRSRRDQLVSALGTDVLAPPRIAVELAPPLKALIIFERRDLLRDCLASWLATTCPEFETLAIATIDSPLSTNAIRRAATVILGSGDGNPLSPPLARQIASVRSICETVPITLIGDPDMRAAETLLNQLDLQGYIPTTSTSEVAAAALRLIAAGGTYVPYLRIRETTTPSAGVPAGLPLITSEAARLLTARERGVLECLRRGLPNKLIAYELGISLGTVKLHVHNIIAKLKVSNRTEAALSPRLAIADPR